MNKFGEFIILSGSLFQVESKRFEKKFSLALDPENLGVCKRILCPLKL